MIDAKFMNDAKFSNTKNLTTHCLLVSLICSVFSDDFLILRRDSSDDVSFSFLPRTALFCFSYHILPVALVAETNYNHVHK